jgi:hypothetical protein
LLKGVSFILDTLGFEFHKRVTSLRKGIFIRFLDLSLWPLALVVRNPSEHVY